MRIKVRYGTGRWWSVDATKEDRDRMIAAETYSSYVECLLRGDRSRCGSIVEQLLKARVDPRDICLGLFQRSLYQVGDLWACHEVSVAVEHVASALTENLLCLVEPAMLSTERTGGTVVVSCGCNEYHHIGARIVADFFEFHGWQTIFVGANVPPADLLRLIDVKHPDLVALSQTVPFNMPLLLDSLDRITSSHPEIPVLVGGQAFSGAGADAIARYSNVEHVSTVEDAEVLIAKGGRYGPRSRR